MKQADGGTRGPIRLCAPASGGRAGGRSRGGITRRHGAIPRGGRLPEFPYLSFDAGPPALLHSFALDERSRIPNPRGIAPYRSLPRARRCAPRSAARCREDRDDWLSPPVVAGLQTRAFDLSFSHPHVPPPPFPR